jgi:two-component system sensor histidine kinase BaeS
LSNLDATRVRQIIDNLMENAVRVTPAGGTIKLSVFDGIETHTIVIDDNGPGLTDEDLPIAFQPAVLHSRYRGLRPVGTGLGLALVGRLAERMGGGASAAHSPLGGAQFIVEFPAARGSDSAD